MNEDAKLFATVTLSIAGTFSLVIFTLIGSTHLFKYIEDTIKFNRYNEALKEYRECAQKYQDEYSVQTYCGGSPSSSILF
jgi:hypothetical protein